MKDNDALIIEDRDNLKQKRFELRELGVYVHIPFCVRKCDYCDFLSAPATEAGKEEYVKALLTEIGSYQGRTADYSVPTVFFGGGTPSCIRGEDIEGIMGEIRRVFRMKEELEATIEVNPGTVTAEKLRMYKKAGLNRISFGLQSTDNGELKRLGRIHSFEEFEENYKMAREIGFTNINIDLMSALPGQTVASWERTLDTVIALKPEHISAYSLIIEEGTKFFERYHPGSPYEAELPDEDTDRRIYYRTGEMLEKAGYHRYEVSNYSKQGYKCRHNDSYWTGIEYLGLGLGAASLINGVRFSNISELRQYISLCRGDKVSVMNKTSAMNKASVMNKAALVFSGESSNINEDLLGIRKDVTALTREQQMEEFMFLGLRRLAGVSKNDFKERFNTEIDNVYGNPLKDLEQKKLILQKEDRISLTNRGIDVSNRVLAEFLLD